MPGKAAAATGQAPAPAVGKVDETRFAEHTPHGRLTAQRGLYAGPAPIVSKDLYAEVVWGSVVRDRAAVVLEPMSKVSGNTYFGRFPASYWQRWTTATEVRVEAVVTGSGQIS